MWVDANPARLEHILSNLLINAVRYAEPNGEIELTVERDGNQGTTRVRDAGLGIAAHELPSAFDLCKRENELAEGSGDGLGIGLNLVRWLVQLHGGSVGTLGEGAGKRQ